MELQRQTGSDLETDKTNFGDFFVRKPLVALRPDSNKEPIHKESCGYTFPFLSKRIFKASRVIKCGIEPHPCLYSDFKRLRRSVAASRQSAAI